jgi:hypothetical protein
MATALSANELAANILRCLQKNEEFQSLSAEIDGISCMCVLTGINLPTKVPWGTFSRNLVQQNLSVR